MTRKKEILPLTGLRFAAAFYVFIFHICLRWPFIPTHFLSQIPGQGTIGMHVFFMLSGFVLTYRYADALQIKEYFLHRFARIYPMYAAVALATLPWLGIEAGNSLHEHVKGLSQGAFLVSTNILLIQAWFPQLFNYWNDGGSWSIAVEAFCYAVFPVLLPWIVHTSRKAAFRLLAFFCALAALPAVSAALFDSANPLIFYVLPVFRLPEFIMGMCICVIYRSGWSQKWPALTQTGTVLLLILLIGFFGDHLTFLIGNSWIALPVIAYFILSLAAHEGFWARMLSSRLMVWLGKISYCFYSCQSLILLVLIEYHDALVRNIPVLKHNYVFFLMAFALLLSCSALTYHSIEAPLRIWLTKKYGRQKPLTV